MEKNFLISLKTVKTIITYSGQRPKVSLRKQTKWLNSCRYGDDSLPVLVRLCLKVENKVSVNVFYPVDHGKPVSEKTVAAVQEELPKTRIC